MTKLTQKQVISTIRAMGMTARCRDGEWRVAFVNDEASAYYTNDADDAIATARAMALRDAGR